MAISISEFKVINKQADLKTSVKLLYIFENINERTGVIINDFNDYINFNVIVVTDKDEIKSFG